MSDPNAAFFIDDTDRKTILYEPQDVWRVSNVSVAFGGTATAGTAGARASLNFTGDAAVVGGIAMTVPGVGPPAVQFSIDNHNPVISTAPNNGSEPFRFPFVGYDNLSPGQHLLEITVLNATEEYPFLLDFVVYEPLNGEAPPPSQSAIVTALPTATIVVFPESFKGSSSSPVGAIVGGVVGGVALLVIVAIAVYLLCFRRTHEVKPCFYAGEARPADMLVLDNETKPTPYEATSPSAAAAIGTSPPPSHYGLSSPLSAYSAPTTYMHAQSEPSELSAATSSFGRTQTSALRLVTALPAGGENPNRSGAMSKATQAGLLSVPQPATYHADSGVRCNSMGESSSSANDAGQDVAGEALADVPPPYSEA
ncbi:hypothetical protein FKP32DRAFT_1600478 [Trametes sanguinea]|nr:hypothetical protein FKP32DRAFT_1600478 [Trametes sanguinea]